MNLLRLAITFLFLYPMLSAAQENSAADNTESNLVIIGASYAENWPISKIGCLDVLNKGINGQVSTEVRDRFEKDALGINPKAVLIWGFINDFSNNPREVADETRETAIRNIEAMAEAAHKAGVIPVLATEVTMGAPDSLLDNLMGWIGSIRGKQSFQQYISTNVMTANEWIRGYAKQKGYPLLDIEKLMTNEEGNRKAGYFTQDLSHITDKAYQDLDAFAEPALEKGLIKPYHLCSE
ncbi:MAG: GDSL-type esterase/lipase family protein [Candidatus Thiodiazotropha sp. L084R]